MTAQLTPTPVQKFFDNNGNPLASGNVYTYIAGTTTPQATYVDSTQTTQNTNPIVLNSRGEANIWLDPTLSYKIVLKDSANNQIWAVDNVKAPVIPIPYGTTSGTNTVTATVAPNFGALTDGLLVFIKIANTITAPPTLNLNSTGALNVYFQDGTTQLIANSWLANNVYGVVYNSSLNSGAGGYTCINPSIPNPTAEGFVNVKWFGAKGDGSTDDTASFQAAVNFAAGTFGLIVIVPFSTAGYKINGTVSMPTAAYNSVRVLGAFSKILVNSANAAFSIFNNSSAFNDPKHILEGMDFVGVTNGTGIGIQITDSQSQCVRNCRFSNLNIGLKLFNTTLWTEQTTMYDLDFWNCNTSIVIDKGASTHLSFASCLFSGIRINTMASASSATPIGIQVTATSSLYRASFQNVVIVPDKNNAVGFAMAGDMSDAFGQVNFENGNGAITGNVAWQFASTFSGNSFSTFSDIRGTIATKVSTTAALVIQGLVIGNLANGNGQIRNINVVSWTRAIYDNDASTLRYAEKVIGGNSMQQLWPYAAPMQFRDPSTNSFVPVNHVSIGTGTQSITTGTTPSSVGIDLAQLNYSGATSITNFTGAVDGQWLHLESVNANPTLVHNNSAGGIVMKSGANFTFAASGTKQLRFVVDRWFEF